MESLVEALQSGSERNLRKSAQLHDVLDRIYLASIDHRAGRWWDDEMLIVLYRFSIHNSNKRLPWSYWNPVVRAGLFQDCTALEDYHWGLISRSARVCWTTEQLSRVTAEVQKPSDGIHHPQLGQGSLIRYMYAYQAWLDQRPNERCSFIPVLFE